MVTAHECGVADQLTLVRSVSAMASHNPQLMIDNPLNKIPVLVLDDGQVLVDSFVICKFLNDLGGGSLFPSIGPAHWRTLSHHALCNGLLDLLIIWRNERDKPTEKQTAEWLSAFALKCGATLDRLEAEMPEIGARPFDIGHVIMGCTLSYMDFRFPAVGWRNARPNLVAWHQGFAARPSVVATEIADG